MKLLTEGVAITSVVGDGLAGSAVVQVVALEVLGRKCASMAVYGVVSCLVTRMLRTKPAIKGIAAPGMPMGSPGMEMGSRKDPYSVMAFTKGGRPTVFAKH